MGGLADAKAARIHGGEARPGDHVADVAAEVRALLLGKRMRQPFLSGDHDPFFPEQIPVPPEGALVQEAKAVQADLERPSRHALLAQFEQIAPYFFFAEL